MSAEDLELLKELIAKAEALQEEKQEMESEESETMDFGEESINSEAAEDLE